MIKRYFVNMGVIAFWTAVLALLLGGPIHSVRQDWGVRGAMCAIPVVLFLILPLVIAREERKAEEQKAGRDRARKDLEESREECEKKDKLKKLFLRQAHVNTGLYELARAYADAHDYVARMSFGQSPINERNHDKVRQFQDEFSRRSNSAWAALNAFTSAVELARANGFTVGNVETYLQEPVVGPV